MLFWRMLHEHWACLFQLGSSIYVFCTPLTLNMFSSYVCTSLNLTMLNPRFHTSLTQNILSPSSMFLYLSNQPPIQRFPVKGATLPSLPRLPHNCSLASFQKTRRGVEKLWFEQCWTANWYLRPPPLPVGWLVGASTHGHIWGMYWPYTTQDTSEASQNNWIGSTNCGEMLPTTSSLCQLNSFDREEWLLLHCIGPLQ